MRDRLLREQQQEAQRRANIELALTDPRGLPSMINQAIGVGEQGLGRQQLAQSQVGQPPAVGPPVEGTDYERRQREQRPSDSLARFAGPIVRGAKKLGNIDVGIGEESAQGYADLGRVLGINDFPGANIVRGLANEALRPSSIAAMAAPIVKGGTLATTIAKNAAIQGGTNLGLDVLAGRTSPRELALSAGLGAAFGAKMSPGVVSTADAVRALRRAGAKLGESEAVERAIARLTDVGPSERGALGGGEIPSDIQRKMGAREALSREEARMMVGARVQQAEHVVGTRPDGSEIRRYRTTFTLTNGDVVTVERPVEVIFADKGANLEDGNAVVDSFSGHDSISITPAAAPQSAPGTSLTGLASERGGGSRLKQLRAQIARIEQDIDRAIGPERRTALVNELAKARNDLARLENPTLPGQADMFGGVAQEAPPAPEAAPAQQGDIFNQPPALRRDPPPTSAAAEVNAAEFGADQSFGVVATSRIRTDPRLQARVTDAGKSFAERRVNDIVNNFDQAQLTPLIVVRDPENPGGFIVVAGHHRLEALKRLGLDAPIQIIDGLDIADPAQLARIQTIADASNATLHPLSLKERINVIRRQGSEDVGALRSTFPAFNDQTIIDALNISRLPGHVVDKLDQLPADSPLVGIASEIGHGMRRFGFTEQDGEALFLRLTKGAKSKLPTRASVRETVDKFGPAFARQAQADLFAGTPQTAFSVRSRLIDAIEEHARLTTDLSRRIRTAASDIKTLLRRGITEDSPQVRAIRQELEALQGRRAQLEAEFGAAIDDRAIATASSPADAGGISRTASTEIPPTGTQRPPEIVSTTGADLPSGSTARRSLPSGERRGETVSEYDITGSIPPERAPVPYRPEEPFSPADEAALALRSDDYMETAGGGRGGALGPPERGLGPEDRARHVEGEIIDEGVTALARSQRPRLLPYQISIARLIAHSFPETVGTSIARGIAKVPLSGKWIIRHLNPSALGDPLVKLATAYKRAVTQGLGTNQVGLAYLTDRRLPFDIGAEGVVRNLPTGSKYGPKATRALVPPGTRTGGFEGEHILDILERATRADVGAHISADQWGWIVSARNIIDDGIDDLLAAHGTVRGTKEAMEILREIGFKQGEHYFPRSVLGRDGVQAARAAMSGGRGSIGARKFFEKSRLHEYVAEGVATGLDYATDPVAMMRTYLNAIRRRTADAELVQIAKVLGKTRSDMGLGKDAFTGALSGIPFGRTGIIPTRTSELPGLQGLIFPADVIDVIERELTDQGAQWLRTVNNVSSLARTAKAGLDLGAPFIHGWPVMFRNFPVWVGATTRSYRAVLDPEIRARWILDNRSVMQDYLDFGGELSEPEFLDAARPGGMLSRGGLISKIPVVGPAVRVGAQRAAVSFDVFLDVARVELWKAARTGAKTDADRYLRMGVVRNLTGTTSMTQLGISRTQQDFEYIALWFANRYTKSAPALVGGFLGGKATAKEAAFGLAAILAGTSAFYYGLAKAQGMNDDEIRTMFNPASGRRFMSIKIGENWIGVGGTYRSLMQLGARSYEASRNDPRAFISHDFERNPMLYWFRSRTSPLAGVAIDFWTGRDFRGNKIDEWQEYLKIIWSRYSPLTVDAIMEGHGGPADRMIAGTSSFFGLRQVSFRAADFRDIAREDGARAAGYRNWEDMWNKMGYSAAEKALRDSSPEYAKLSDKTRAEGQERREERGERALSDVLQRFTDEQRQADADPELSEWQDWIDDRQGRNQRKSGALDEWERTHQAEARFLNTQMAKIRDPFKLAADAKPDDIKAAYLKVFKAHKTATGGIDDLDALGKDLDRFTSMLAPEQLDALYANAGTQATAREREYQGLIRPLASGGYFDRSDQIFQRWRDGIPAGAPLKEIARSWDDVGDLQRWAKDEVVRQGQPEQYYTFEPWHRSWEKFFDQENGIWLATNPYLDALAIVLGYQKRTHSAEAERIYEELSGQRAPVPATR